MREGWRSASSGEEGGAVRLDDLEKAVDDRTKAVSVSHVEWLTGARHDIGAFAEVAHEHGAYLVVDGIQAAGAIKVDVKRSGSRLLRVRRLQVARWLQRRWLPLCQEGPDHGD